MTETTEIVYIVAPGRSIVVGSPLGKGRLTLTNKTIVRPGRYPGIDQTEMDAMVERGELLKTALTEVGELPNADLSDRTPVMQTGSPEAPMDADAPSVGGEGLKRNLDPVSLREQVAAGALGLEKLNLLIRQRDPSMAPLHDVREAINWLSIESDRRPPMPPVAPSA